MSVWLIILAGDVMPLALAGVLALVFAIVPFGRHRLSRIIVRTPARQGSDLGASAVIGASALILALSALIRLCLELAHLQPAPFSYVWWRNAQELLFASAALAVILAILIVGRRRPEVPVPPMKLRTWRTYISRSQLWVACLALAALLVLVVFAGSISSPDENGIYRLLTVASGDGTQGSGEFFGWAYGLPVAVTALVLSVFAVGALHVIATRPFLRPDSVALEESERRALSARVVWFGSGALLLTLSQSLVSVGAGALTTLSTSNYEWGTGIAALAPWLSWAGLLG